VPAFDLKKEIVVLTFLLRGINKNVKEDCGKYCQNQAQKNQEPCPDFSSNQFKNK
jgi:hypothetical protein